MIDKQQLGTNHLYAGNYHHSINLPLGIGCAATPVEYGTKCVRVSWVGIPDKDRASFSTFAATPVFGWRFGVSDSILIRVPSK